MSSARTIKTPIADYGQLNLRSGSSLGSLMEIGALCHTARHDKEKARVIMQTDAEGLELLDSEAHSAMLQICASVMSLGKMLAYVDTEEVGDLDLKNMGWLLISLGELGMDLQNARDLIESNLQHEAARATG